MLASRSIVASVCLTFLAMACLADTRSTGYGPNPQYEAWKSFKVGTFIRIENSSDPRIIRYKTARLVALTAESATIEYGEGTITADGTDERKPQAVQVSARTYIVSSTTQPHGDVTEGDEELTIAGRKVQAHWKQTVIKDIDLDKSEVTITRKVWTSPQVPGGVAIDQSSTESGDRVKGYAWKVVEIKEPE